MKPTANEAFDMINATTPATSEEEIVTILHAIAAASKIYRPVMLTDLAKKCGAPYPDIARLFRETVTFPPQEVAYDLISNLASSWMLGHNNDVEDLFEALREVDKTSGDLKDAYLERLRHIPRFSVDSLKRLTMIAKEQTNG